MSWQVWDLYFGLPSGAVWSNLLASVICLAVGYSVAWRKFMCSTKGCWRLGLHKVSGTTYRTCLKHTDKRHHDRLRIRHKAERTGADEVSS